MEKKCSQCEFFVHEEYEANWCCLNGNRFVDGEPEVCEEFNEKEELYGDEPALR